jgi:hypothetical protein
MAHPGASHSWRYVAPLHPPRPSGPDHFVTVLRNLPGLVVLAALVWLLIIWVCPK